MGLGRRRRPPPPPPTPPSPHANTASGGAGKSDAFPVSLRSWSCQVATKGPEGRKAGTCEIWTNIPSEGSASAPSPSPGLGLGGARGASVVRPGRGEKGGGGGEGWGRRGGGGTGAGAAAPTGRDDNAVSYSCTWAVGKAVGRRGGGLSDTFVNCTVNQVCFCLLTPYTTAVNNRSEGGVRTWPLTLLDHATISRYVRATEMLYRRKLAEVTRQVDIFNEYLV